jgi:hypothetical protein
MPITPNPIPRIALPFRHEGSSLRHLRDGDSIGREWQKAKKDNDALRGQGLALSRLQKQFDSLKRPKNQIDRWFPFKIYNVPPQYCSNPNDSWRTFRVRSGFVGWRTMYGAPSWDSNTWERAWLVNTGGDGDWLYDDPHNGYQSSIIQTFVNGNYEVVSVPSTGTSGATSSYGRHAEFVLNSGLDTVNERWAEFWIEISDPNDATTHDQDIDVQIKCRMFSWSAGDPRPLGLIQASQNQIPIGMVSVRKSDDPEPLLNTPAFGYAIDQLLYDHCLNRYPLGYYNPTIVDLYSSGGMVYRGEAWYSDHTGLNWSATGVGDSPLVTATFYPGDVVAYKSNNGDDTKELSAIYVYAAEPAQEVEPPQRWSSSGTWELVNRSEFTL